MPNIIFLLKNMKICHISTAHPRYDVRIFLKECVSLSKSFQEVHLIIADGLGDETKNNVIIHDIGKPQTRKDRFLNFSKLALIKAKELKADLYHLHDPELLRIALKLQKSGAKVIYDSRRCAKTNFKQRYILDILEKLSQNCKNKKTKFLKLNGIVTDSMGIDF